MQSFERLRVWRRADELARSIYGITASFPKEEVYGLVSQMRRASVSITSNIAEGAGRESAADFARFLTIASGSASELESQLRFVADQGFVDVAEARRLRNECRAIRRMLSSLKRRLHEAG